MSSYVTRKTPGNTEWFRADRFGMFIHWGLYALPARHEWIKNMECIPEEKYQKYFEHFNPDLYDARAWAKAAKAADAMLVGGAGHILFHKFHCAITGGNIHTGGSVACRIALFHD